MTTFLNSLQKQYKHPVLVPAHKIKKVEFITEKFTTGCSQLDKDLEGGWPVGKQIQISGKNQSGKTTLLLHTIAELLKDNKMVMYLDLERRIDWGWAKKIGMDIESENLHLLPLKETDGKKFVGYCMEEILDIIIQSLIYKSAKYKLIVVDSIPGLIPRAVLNGEIGDAHMGLQSRIFGSHLPIIQNWIVHKKTTIIWVNQIRDNIQTGFGSQFAPKTKTPGGNTKDHYYSTHIKLSNSKKIKSDGVVDGVTIKYTIAKSNHGGAYQEGTFDIYNNRGICGVKSLFDFCLAEKIITRNGPMYSVPTIEKKINGQNNVISKLIQDEKLQNELIKLLENKNKNGHTTD